RPPVSPPFVLGLWGSARRRCERSMRDDFIALSNIRMFPDAAMSQAQARPAPSAGASNFETALANAAKARDTLNAQRRYVSPLKAKTTTLRAPTILHKPALPKVATPSQTPTLRPPVRIKPAAPLAPVQRPEAPRPATTTTPALPMAPSDYPH